MSPCTPPKSKIATQVHGPLLLQLAMPWLVKAGSMTKAGVRLRLAPTTAPCRRPTHRGAWRRGHRTRAAQAHIASLMCSKLGLGTQPDTRQRRRRPLQLMLRTYFGGVGEKIRAVQTYVRCAAGSLCMRAPRKGCNASQAVGEACVGCCFNAMLAPHRLPPGRGTSHAHAVQRRGQPNGLRRPCGPNASNASYCMTHTSRHGHALRQAGQAAHHGMAAVDSLAHMCAWQLTR